MEKIFSLRQQQRGNGRNFSLAGTKDLYANSRNANKFTWNFCIEKLSTLIRIAGDSTQLFVLLQYLSTLKCSCKYDLIDDVDKKIILILIFLFSPECGEAYRKTFLTRMYSDKRSFCELSQFWLVCLDGASFHSA